MICGILQGIVKPTPPLDGKFPVVSLTTRNQGRRKHYKSGGGAPFQGFWN